MSTIKEKIKKYKIVKHIHKKFTPLLVKTSPVMATKIFHILATGKKLNLKEPKDFNEKLQWLKLYWQNPLVAKCADKFEIRDYAMGCGCGRILNPLYYVYEDVNEINWDSLPNKFALKATHGCGFNIICSDKTKIDKDQTIRQLNEWLRIDYSLLTAELQYSKIKPRIICEKYIETDEGILPYDYKVYCFNGKAKLILVCREREKKLKLDFLDLQWERMDIGADNYNQGIIPEKPECLEQLIKYAEKLAEPFPWVRVDFYISNGQPILGEMTFTPYGCMATYYNEYGLELLGNMLKLPEKYVSNKSNVSVNS